MDTMPKQNRNPRIAISMSPEMQRTFTEFAEAQELATASAVRSLLEEMLPQIQALTKAINRAKREPEEALEDMRDFFVESQAQVAQASLHLNDEIRKKKRAIKK